ncbi:hypothetical protein [Vibrio panuliri]|uniref:hypothetical protein n=1 Tax=Vibrio panuliri TaxID=1381081 RepID=UPI001CE2865B|nr:hypothetical protein [Vibrio panuliri]
MYLNNLCKSLVTFFAVFMLSACAPDPQDDIPLFESYIKENINKNSNDPYISSSVRPEDELYEYLSKLQQGQGYRTILEPLIEKGNTEAMVWMARGGADFIEERVKAITLLGKAMQLGDPFAALALSSKGEECNYFHKDSINSQLISDLGGDISDDIETCSDENWNKALQGINDLAVNGDLSAQYYLLERQRIDNPEETRESRDFYIKEIIRLAEGHYYKPMMDYVESIFHRDRRHDRLIGNTPELEKLGVELMTIAANHNYIPAINFLIEYQWETIDANDPLFNRGIMLGSQNTVTWLLNIFAKQFEKEFSEEEIYFYSSIFEFITGSDDMFSRKYEEGSLSEKERQKIDAEVVKVTEQITPMVYIDRFTDRTNWVDR